MKIVVICEGDSEEALKHVLRKFVQRGAAKRVGVDTLPLDGPTLRKKLARVVKLSLARRGVVGVVALTDVHPDFSNAEDAKAALYRYSGQNMKTGQFRAHAAKFELEAWLMPFWNEIAKSLGVRAKKPGARPEDINNEKPPSIHLSDLYRRANSKYLKAVHVAKWLTADNLETAAEQCPELRAFLNSLLEFAQAKETN